jgi:glyceraldehyde-3-phosphate dehydrogenase (ferredoxin)
MKAHQRVLRIDTTTGFYRLERFAIGNFFGPVDLGLHLSRKYNSLNIGVGLLAGSIFPGTNRLIFNGFSPCWGGFYISSMGGAGLVFENLGINMLSLVGKAPQPSLLYLNRVEGESVDVELIPVDIHAIWNGGRGGIYSVIDKAFELLGDQYKEDPRVMAVGPAAASTDVAGIASVPIKKGTVTFVDTWAGRGGFGSKLFQEHGLVGIIYGGTYLDEDFRDRKVADQWFEERYNKKLATKDFEATTKYRFDPNVETGGTFGVNYATLKGRIMAFNYKTIYWTEEQRLDLHKRFIVDHYLKQFNEETILPKQQKNCGEPCAALCKKLRDEYKKDYEPYQTMGPLIGVFDQRAAERVNHHADMLGFDGISIGGVLAWLMECLDRGMLLPMELGVDETPRFDWKNFDVVKDSMHNAELGCHLLDSIIQKKGVLDFTEGARKWARRLSRRKGTKLLDLFVFNAFARKGWMVPNQYWTPGVLSPMAIMGKYYMYYGEEFKPPRELGRLNAERFIQELILDNLGTCRFHRKWAEDILPEVMDRLFGAKDEFLNSIRMTASRINARNASGFWESQRNVDYIVQFLRRLWDMKITNDSELEEWITRFKNDEHETALDFWYEIHKGINDVLRVYL